MTININGNTYPVFEANQVLRHTDLKGLFDYLDGHHRLTRTYLIGMGIVCGLTVEFQSDPASIQVGHGCGVTSEGYLIHLPEAVSLGYYQTADVSEGLFKPTPPTGNASPNGNGNGNRGSSISNTVPVIELFAASADDRLPLAQTPDSSDIKEFIAAHVVVLVCELDETQRDSCLADCDSRGRDRNLRTRFFLLPKMGEGDQLTAEKLLRQGYPFDDLGAAWAGLGTEAVLTASRDFWRDPHLRVRRFGYGEETPPNSTQAVPIVRLSAIKNFDGLLANYYEICNRAIADIASAFPRLFRIFSPFFSTFHPDTTDDFAGLEGRLTARLRAIWSPESPDPAQLEAVEAQYAMQYFYDYLSQLVAAYYELATAAFDLMDDCAPDSRRFPKFLMLGEPIFSGTSEPCPVPSAYRHHFVQPPIYNGNQQRVQQVHHLYQRLHRLCADDAFLMLPFYDTPLAITPSPNRAAPLSQQAIPYYLNYPQIYPYWNYDACRKGISDRHPAYFYPLTSGSPTTTTELLVHRLDAYNFYRIEGHVGETRANALEQIQAYQQRYNLAFDVITLKLSPSIDNLQDLDFSGYFDDLEADFGRMKDKFLKLWDKHENRDDPQEHWSRNVFINTLRQEFFDDQVKSSELLGIREGQILNPVLTFAKKPDNYNFVPELGTDNQPTGRYWLYVVDQNRSQVARFSPQQNLSPNDDLDDLIDFTGLSNEGVTAEQERIRETLAACFGLGQVEFRVMQPPRNGFTFYVQLFVDDTLNLPIQARGTVEIALLWLTPFTVSLAATGEPSMSQAEFRNFETLYRLLWDVPDEFADNQDLPFQMGDQEAAECLNYYEFKGLMEAYLHRLERLKELHLFHNFAGQHPGMEPLGGVPNGGTFVLVYVDGEEIVNDLLKIEQNAAFRARTSAIRQYAGFPFEFLSAFLVQQESLNRVDVVVADFCLPYRCCSDTPAVSYLLAKPRPIVLLTKSAFCEDDETRYEFILDPAGGILKGEGTFLDDDTYYFQPSLVEDISADRTVTFTYAVEGSYDTFTVAIYPEPTGRLLNINSQFCNNNAPIEFDFSGDDPAVELVSVRVGETVIERFDPSQYARNGEQEDVTLVVLLRDRRTNCEATVETTVTVHPLPNADFGFNPPPNSETQGYCHGEVEEIELDPADFEVSDRFEIAGEAADLVRLNENRLSLEGLSKWFEANESPVTLTVVHVASNQACEARSDEQTITIYPKPRPSFRLVDSDERDVANVCSNGQPIRILLEPNSETYTLEAITEDDDPISLNTDTNPPQFDPRVVSSRLFGNRASLRVDITYTVEGEGGCEGSITQPINVFSNPTVDFSLELLSNTPTNITVRVFNIQPQGDVSSLRFRWNFDPGTRSRAESENEDFTVTYNREQLRGRTEIVVTLEGYSMAPMGLYCFGPLVERRIQPIPPPPGNGSPGQPGSPGGGGSPVVDITRGGGGLI